MRKPRLEFVPASLCSIEGWGAALAIGGSAIAGAAISAGGAEAAAGQQAGAAEQAQQISENEFQTINAQESPYLSAGYGATSQLNYLLGNGPPGTTGPTGTTASSSTGGGYGSLISPFTAQNFQQMSPAYQFQLQQGQQGVLNTDSSSQGALSGAALKDLTSYNQNMANTSFNNAFNQYQTQQSNIYSRLAGIANLGQSAASQQAQSGTALAGQAAQSATNVGTALAGGTVGATNALGGGVSNLGTLLALQNSGSNPLATSIANGNNVISNANAIEQAPF
jgi:hypothetical protein